ncbi:hypothetical protein GCM10023185_16970 [Hymenobacter saemangeumensis]|uniref:Uncharacterized protein n=1 Tax=Hymenobacter saemangeumensis TaxID=1084522 RepID=A0ABP8IAN2_9BACT
MSYRHLLYLAGMLTTAACSSPSETASEHAAPVETGESIATATAGPVLRVIERRRLFATPNAPDVFRLELLGDSLLSASALLIIRTATGQELYRQELRPGELEAALVYELKAGEQPSRARREAYLRQRRAEFFSDDKFTSPAIGPEEAMQPEYADLPTWNSLKLPGTVGFSFQVGKEDGHRIAWVPAKKKVLRYAGFGGG